MMGIAPRQRVRMIVTGLIDPDHDIRFSRRDKRYTPWAEFGVVVTEPLAPGDDLITSVSVFGMGGPLVEAAKVMKPGDLVRVEGVFTSAGDHHRLAMEAAKLEILDDGDFIASRYEPFGDWGELCE